jgi:hypothetical protein
LRREIWFWRVLIWRDWEIWVVEDVEGLSRERE